jgi:hypothetical protein
VTLQISRKMIVDFIESEKETDLDGWKQAIKNNDKN